MDPELKKLLKSVFDKFPLNRHIDHQSCFGFIYDLCTDDAERTPVNSKFYTQHLQLLTALPQKLIVRGWVNWGVVTDSPIRCRLYMNLINGRSVHAVCKLTVAKIQSIPGFHSIKLPERAEDFNLRTDNCLLVFTTLAARNRTMDLLRSNACRLKTSNPPPLTHGQTFNQEDMGQELVMGFGDEPVYEVDLNASRPYHPRFFQTRTSFNRLRANLISLALQHTRTIYSSGNEDVYPREETPYDTFVYLVRLYFGKCNISLTDPATGGRELLF